MALKTLDFGKFTHGTEDERLSFAKDLVSSFKEYGFAKLINHGVPPAVVKDHMSLARRFFSMQYEDKLKIANKKGPQPQRGYSIVGEEQTSRLKPQNLEGQTDWDALRDVREHFDCGPPEEAEFPNKWPDEDLPEFRTMLESCFDIFQGTSLTIMRALELGLDVPHDTLVHKCQPSASELRLNHYPKISMEVLAEGKSKRTWPHTDFGILTLLFQDGTGGLEIEDRSKPNTFIPIMPGRSDGPSEMVINVSDTLQRWTNDVIKAGLHQVSPPQNMKGRQVGFCPDRYSTIFFLKAHRETMVGSLPQFVTKDMPAKYDEITALQFQQRMTNILYQ